MSIYGVVAGWIALLLLVFMEAPFLIAPNKANEWFGTWTTQGEHPLMLRLFGLIWIAVALLFAGLIVGAISK